MKDNRVVKEYSKEITTCSQCPYFIIDEMLSEKTFLPSLSPACSKVQPQKHKNVDPLFSPKGRIIETYGMLRDFLIPAWCPLPNKKDPGVKVGVTAIIVRKDKKVLLGERGDKVETFKNMHAFPGGRMDFGENGPKVALAREVKEETDLDVNPNDFKFVRESDEPFIAEGKHYISLVYITHKFSGELKNMEGTDKCKGWGWFSINNLPSNIFLPVRESIEFAKELILNS